jgi:hypothetical protein
MTGEEILSAFPTVTQGDLDEIRDGGTVWQTATDREGTLCRISYDDDGGELFTVTDNFMSTTAASFREALTAELERIKTTRFVDGYQATDAEALGIITAQFFDWDGVDIMEAAGYALEDANFHTEAGQVRDMAKQYEE